MGEVVNMRKSNLQQLDEQVKTQHKQWESLSPEERRALVIQMRDTQTKTSQQSIIFLAFIGCLFSAATIYFWLNEYNMSLASSLGIIGGMVLAALGFQYLKSNRIKSNRKIQSSDFNDEDVIAYFREHEKVNRRALEQWNKNKYLVFIFGGILILMLNMRSTVAFVVMALASGISIFLLGLVIFSIIQKSKITSK